MLLGARDTSPSLIRQWLGGARILWGSGPSGGPFLLRLGQGKLSLVAEKLSPTPVWQGWESGMDRGVLRGAWGAIWALSPDYTMPTPFIAPRRQCSCPLNPHFNAPCSPLTSLPQQVKPCHLEWIPALPTHLEAWPRFVPRVSCPICPNAG